MEERIYAQLDKNKKEIKSFFGESADYFEKDLMILGHRAALLMCEDLTNITNLWQVNLKPLNNLKADFTPEQVFDYISKQTTIPFNSQPAETFEKIMFFLTAGFSIILIDGVVKALAAPARGYSARSISSPVAEGS